MKCKIFKNSYYPIDLNFKNIVKTAMCLFIGHKVDNTTDSGYLYCTRCYAHEYWDNQEYNSKKWKRSKLLIRPYIFLINYYRKTYSLIIFKYKNELPF